MSSLNKVILIGNIVEDVEIKQTPSGVAVCNFRIAVNRKFAKEGQQNVDFISIVAWRQAAEYVGRWGSKGRNILVCGSLQQRNWTDDNGNKRSVLEVQADEVSFTDRKPDFTQTTDAPVVPTSSPAPYTSDVSYEDFEGDDSMPF